MARATDDDYRIQHLGIESRHSLGREHARTAHRLDLLLGQLGELLGLDNQGLLGQLTLAKHLEDALRRGRGGVRGRLSGQAFGVAQRRGEGRVRGVRVRGGEGGGRDGRRRGCCEVGACPPGERRRRGGGSSGTAGGGGGGGGTGRRRWGWAPSGEGVCCGPGRPSSSSERCTGGLTDSRRVPTRPAAGSRRLDLPSTSALHGPKSEAAAAAAAPDGWVRAKV